MEAVALLEPGSKTVVVDASTAFRVADGAHMLRPTALPAGERAKRPSLRRRCAAVGRHPGRGGPSLLAPSSWRRSGVEDHSDAHSPCARAYPPRHPPQGGCTGSRSSNPATRRRWPGRSASPTPGAGPSLPSRATHAPPDTRSLRRHQTHTLTPPAPATQVLPHGLHRPHPPARRCRAPRPGRRPRLPRGVWVQRRRQGADQGALLASAARRRGGGMRAGPSGGPVWSARPRTSRVRPCSNRCSSRRRTSPGGRTVLTSRTSTCRRWPSGAPRHPTSLAPRRPSTPPYSPRSELTSHLPRLPAGPASAASPSSVRPSGISRRGWSCPCPSTTTSWPPAPRGSGCRRPSRRTTRGPSSCPSGR